MSPQSHDIERTKVMMQSILSDVIEKSESYKFIRMADDLHDVAQYLNDMRLCFVAVTITGYVLLIIYFFVLCMRRNRQTQPRRRNWDYPMDNTRDFNNTTAPQTDELTSVRTDGNIGYGRRTHANAVPSFMRHGQMNHQQTRLMAEQDGAVVRRGGATETKPLAPLSHQIPHITTEPPVDEKSKVPQLMKDTMDS